MYRYHTVSYFNISKALLSELNEKVIPVNVSSPCCHSSYNLYMYHNKPYILIVHLNMLCTFTDVHYNVYKHVLALQYVDIWRLGIINTQI